VEIFKEYSIEAAHYLPNVPPGHKCGRLHGHSFKIKLFVTGNPDEATGWLMDFAEISRVFAPVYQQLDHHFLNEIDGLENPTCENITRWIWQKLKPELPQLSQVEVQETCTGGCRYRGELDEEG
jgi:6-pyruvoyltetrahydropterin/6-carboxytetrahydropterin synthase